MKVEMGIAQERGSWDTATVEIPDNTPEDKIEAVAREALVKAEYTGVGTFLYGYYIDEASDDEDADRLDRFYAELERRQEDGDPLTCASCNAAIQPGESADPCFRCGQPLCFYCSTSGPRCRGCADLP